MSEIDSAQAVKWGGDMIDWNTISIGVASVGAVRGEARGADANLVTVTVP
jgi:hypothetical protein